MCCCCILFVIDVYYKPHRKMDSPSWIIHTLVCPLTTCAFQLQNRNRSRGWRAKAAKQYFFTGKENTLMRKRHQRGSRYRINIYFCGATVLFLPDEVRNGFVCPLESRKRPRWSLWSEKDRREIKSLFDGGHRTTCAALIDSSDCLSIYCRCMCTNHSFMVRETL